MEIRDKLLDAAARVYAESGFRGATTRRIAEAAGVNEITLFRHFGSKAALLQAAVARARVGPIAPLPETPADPAAELLDWARSHRAALAERCAIIRTCLAEAGEHREMLPTQGSAPARAAELLCEYVERLREQGRAQRDFDAGAAAAMLMGALFADAMGRDLMPDLYRNDPDEALVQYVHLFLRAIGTNQ